MLIIKLLPIVVLYQMHPSLQYSLKSLKFIKLEPHKTIQNNEANKQTLKWYATQEQTNLLGGQLDELQLDILMENKDKRDLFTSRGWGAGGQSYNPYTYDKINRKAQHPQMNKQYDHDPVAVPLINDEEALWIKNEDELNNKQINLQVEKLVKLRRQSQTKARKVKPHIPQFFLSYGWGPNGEK